VAVSERDGRVETLDQCCKEKDGKKHVPEGVASFEIDVVGERRRGKGIKGGGEKGRSVGWEEEL